jgi:predicted regulator of Ras-like GTPase activity (Roadblock/LC7/MglB family)
MKVLDEVVQDAISSGIAKQLVVADRDGLIVEEKGDEFDSEELVASMLRALGAVGQIETTLRTLPVSELVVHLDSDDLMISTRFVLVDEEPFLLIVVVPKGSNYRVLSGHIIRNLRNKSKGA